MRRRGSAAHLIACVLALLQLGTPAFSAIADAKFAADSAAATSHVEATGSTTCPAVHPPDCGICRYLGTGGLPEARPEMARPANERRTLPSFDVGCRAAAQVILPHGRAPPAV